MMLQPLYCMVVKKVLVLLAVLCATPAHNQYHLLECTSQTAASTGFGTAVAMKASLAKATSAGLANTAAMLSSLAPMERLLELVLEPPTNGQKHC
jgi:hypothetical protein